MSSTMQTELNKIKKSIEEKLNTISKLNDNELKNKNKDIISMINYYNSLTDKIEDRRIRIYENTLQYIIVLLTATTLVYSIRANVNTIFYYAILAIFISQLLSSLIILLVYEIQSKCNYVFKEISDYSNKWKWFYYGNQNILKIDIYSKNNPNNTVIPYLKGLDMFIKNYIEENDTIEIQNNIQQLYLLQVHNYYKNRFFLNLINIRFYSIIISIFSIIVVIIVA